MDNEKPKFAPFTPSWHFVNPEWHDKIVASYGAGEEGEITKAEDGTASWEGFDPDHTFDGTFANTLFGAVTAIDNCDPDVEEECTITKEPGCSPE